MAASIEHVLSQIQRWTSLRLEENSDTLLLQRFVQHRDERAFAALVSRHGGMVLRSCRRVLGDVHDAEDAFQAVFLILARKAHTLRRPAELPGWLHGVARRVALKARTKSISRAAEMLPSEELPDTASDPLARLTARELLTVLDEEVARLPRPQRSAVVMCCLEGHPQEEAARRLGWTAGSLKGHLERGWRRLHDRLQRRGITLSAALALIAVSRGEAVSALVHRSAVRAAFDYAASNPMAAALAESVLKGTFAGKLAGVTAMVMTMALAVSAAALVYHSPAEPSDKNAPAATNETRDSKPEKRVDGHGDPLPAGAIARLGTLRFRHGGNIVLVTFTPDGKRLVTQGSDGVRLWDAATGKELRHLAPEMGAIWGHSDLSPDGKQVAVTGHVPAGPIELWDVDSGKKIGTLGERFYLPVRFSPDGKLLAASSTLNEVDIWELSTRKKLRSWKVHPLQLWTIAFSADSHKLLTTGTEGKAFLWDVATGKQLQEFTPSGWQPNVIGTPPETVLSPDGKLVAMIEKNEAVKQADGPTRWEARISLFDTATGKRLRQLSCPTPKIKTGQRSQGYNRPFGALTFSADGAKLLTGGPDDFLRLWDPATGAELHRLRFDSGWVSALTLSRDGKTIAAIGLGGRAVCVVDMASGRIRAESPGHLTGIQASALTPDGRTAITTSLENALLVWDVATGQPRRLQGHDSPVHSLYLTPDGWTLYSGSWDRTLRVWDLRAGRQLRQLNIDLPQTGLGKVLLSADGKNLVLVDSSQTVRLLDVATGKERQNFRVPDWILGWALTPDRRSLVGWFGDRKVRVWDVASGTLRHEYSLPPPHIGDGPVPVGVQASPSLYKAALSPDGRLLAVGSEENPAPSGKPNHFLLLMELATGREVLRLDKVSSGPSSICFSPDGRMLAWGGTGDAAVHLAEVATGRERRRFDGHRGFVSSLAFSANGERLISGGMDTTALVWDLCGRPEPRVLSAAEAEALWTDLSGADAVRAYRAIRKLAAVPNASVPFLRKHLRPVPPLDEKHLNRLIGDLDNDDFAIRRKAAVELAKLQDEPLTAYRKALEGKPSLETRRRLEELLEKAVPAWWDVSGERLRMLRAIEMLELAATEEARDVLETLAAGAEGTRLTEEAKAALRRLANRQR